MRGDYGLIFWAHLVVILVILASPFIFRAHWIAVGIVLFYLQLWFFGGCVLTTAQFPVHLGIVPRTYRLDGDSFYHYYLEKFGIRIDRRKLNVFLDFVLPMILLGVAFLWKTF